MDPLNIRQPVSLSTVYEARPAEGGGGIGRLGGKSVEQSDEGVGRANRTKTTWDRFTSRVSHGFSAFKDIFVSKDSEADRRAVRFNARHEKFSGSVHELVGNLAKGVKTGVESADLMATLRNDVKLMNKDVPWAKREQILNARLDIELSALSSDQLTEVAKSLADADVSALTDKDKADLGTMKAAVLRQQISRGPEMTAVFAQVKHDDPSNVSERMQLLDNLANLKDDVTAKMTALGLPHDEAQVDALVGGAMRLRLKSGDPARDMLPGMNRNLLNMETDMRKTDLDSPTPRSARHGEIILLSPQLRTLGRAVREEFLKDKADTFKDTELRSRMSVLGKGAAHEVSKGTYALGDAAVGKVHKYDDDQVRSSSGSRFAAPEAMGIDQSSPRLLERAVFTARCDAQLGFNVSVGTDFAYHRDQVGIVMDMVEGQTAHETYGHGQSRSPVVQRDLVKLQLLDVLTGQGDRHGGNYMVQSEDGRTITGIKAIDSDFCMGSRSVDIRDTVGKHGVHLPGLPPVIDTDMAAAIDRMQPEDLVRMADNMFDDRALDGAKARLTVLKDHVAVLRGQGNVIPPDEWGNDRVTTLLKKTEVDAVDSQGAATKEPTSYWQRDRGIFNRGFDAFAGGGF